MNHRQSFLVSLLPLLLTGICVTGCDLINPSEPIPARIQLKAFDLQVSSGQGSGQNKITDIWTYADGTFVGVFSPNIEFPYLGDKDQTTFTFHPGIRNNGIADDPIEYPLYTTYEITLNTTAGTVSVVNPITKYKSNVVISLNADFENGNDFIDNRDTVAGSFVARTMESPFEGSYSGEIVLSASANYIEVGNAVPLSNLPTDGTPCYLEFQYKSEMEMSIGVLGVSLTGQRYSNFFYLVRPTEDWNMLYINLSDVLKASDFPAYEILFRSLYPSNATKSELKIELDNIKVVHL